MSNRLFWICLFLSFSAFSQQTAIYTDSEYGYRRGLDLFAKQKYVAAQQEFDKALQSGTALTLESRAEATFYAARCAAELFRRDTEYRLLRFLND